MVSISYFIFSCSQSFDEKEISKDITAKSRAEKRDLLDLLGTACVPGNIVVPGACNDTIFVDTLIITDLPQYPGCKFKVIYKRQECKIPSIRDITIGDFQILEHDCDAFSADINNKWNQSIWSDFIIDFELSVYGAVQNHLITQNVTEEFNCLEGVLFTINFIRASCYRYASVRQKNGQSVSTKLTCGSQCCERHTRVCRNPDGTFNITTNDVTNPSNVDCGDPAFLTNPPYWLGRPDWITECTVICPN